MSDHCDSDWKSTSYGLKKIFAELIWHSCLLPKHLDARTIRRPALVGDTRRLRQLTSKYRSRAQSTVVRQPTSDRGKKAFGYLARSEIEELKNWRPWRLRANEACCTLLPPHDRLRGGWASQYGESGEDTQRFLGITRTVLKCPQSAGRVFVKWKRSDYLQQRIQDVQVIRAKDGREEILI